MTPKVFIGWAFTAIVMVIAAVAIAFSQPAIMTVNLDNEPAFPKVRGNANVITKIVIGSPEDSFALIRSEAGPWIASDKFGYPADSKKVRELIVTMADMKLIEAKTKRPDRYARLEVEDLDEGDAGSRRVRLETAGDAVLAETLVGKNRYRLTGRSESGTYIRRPGEAQAWLASGKLSPDTRLVNWLDREIVDLARGSVQRVEISPHGGQAYVATRADSGAAFRIEDLPEGRKVKDGATRSLDNVLANVDLDDVKPRGEVELPVERHSAAVTTFGGVAVAVELAKIDEAHWAVFSANYVGDSTEDVEAGKTAQARVEEINNRVGGWVYQIPDYIAQRLSKPLYEFLEPSEKTS